MRILLSVLYSIWSSVAFILHFPGIREGFVCGKRKVRTIQDFAAEPSGEPAISTNPKCFWFGKSGQRSSARSIPVSFCWTKNFTGFRHSPHNFRQPAKTNLEILVLSDCQTEQTLSSLENTETMRHGWLSKQRELVFKAGTSNSLFGLNVMATRSSFSAGCVVFWVFFFKLQTKVNLERKQV